MTPFLKWPGGKRWFVHQFASSLPIRFDRYIEPFLGGGSVYFHLHPEKAILSDTNQELITTYRAVRADWRKVVAALRRHNKSHSEAHYYRTRGS